MDEEIRKDIERTNNDLNHEKDLMSWYSKEKDEEAIRNGEISEFFEDGRKAGVEEGIDLGRSQGIEQRNMELAKSFKEKGVSINIIAESTGLSISEIEKL